MSLLRKCSVLVAALALSCASHAQAPVVNLYTTREPALIQPLLDAFSKESGIKVNTVFLAEGLLERVQAEGKNSPADLLMTVDSGNLLDLVNAGLTQPVQSKTLTAAIPANLRGATGAWFALSLRDRVVYADKSVSQDTLNYEDLAKPEWRGKICLRSGQHPYNISLIAAMIAHYGEAKTEAWLRGVKANFARKPAGGDRDVARDILAGQCDIGLANAYYVGKMKTAPEGDPQRSWVEAIRVIRPTFAGKGTHVNISGAGLAKHAPNRANALRLLEFLVSDSAQSLYAKANFEYPVKAGVALDPIVASMGTLRADSLQIADIVKHRKAASLLVDRVGFDQ
jgi:iron(III) transport system substrate-binding protein